MKAIFLSTAAALSVVAGLAAAPAVAQSTAQDLAIALHNDSADGAGDRIAVKSSRTANFTTSSDGLSRAQRIAIRIHNESADGQGDRIALR